MGNVRFWTGKNVWLDGYKCEEKKVFQLYVVSYVFKRCIVACAWISYGVFLDIYVGLHAHRVWLPCVQVQMRLPGHFLIGNFRSCTNPWWDDSYIQ